jgi:ATP-binding cassette subfamily B protein
VSAATFGTANEDNTLLSKADSKAVRRRSLALLASLIRPVRLRFWLTIAMVVLSQLTRVAGPALIAFGIDNALPASAGRRQRAAGAGRRRCTWRLHIATAGMTALYVTSTARLSQAMLLDLRSGVPAHPAVEPGIPREVHLGPHHCPADLGSGGPARAPGFRRELLASGLLFMVFTAVTVFALDWRSGLMVLAAGVPMFFLARWYQKHSQIAFRESRVVSARLIVHFVETMTGIRAVKAFRKERENAGPYGELAEDYRRTLSAPST